MSRKPKTPKSDWDHLPEGVKRNAFSPIDDPDVVRLNCKTTTIIERDGSLRERVSLQVANPHHREQLVCLHYLRHHARCFLTERSDGVLPKEVGIDIISRDAPWDFEIALSTGARFFVEITAIADHQFRFEREKREERLRLVSGQPQIRVRDLRKLACMFPSERIDAIVASHARTAADLEVANPYLRQGEHLMLGQVVRRNQPLCKQILEAIDRKAAKKHANKDTTVLILDYRGNFPDQNELRSTCREIGNYLEACPFMEIWFYVGYFSDDIGNNAEFSFTALKLGEEKSMKLLKLSETKGLDSFDRLVW